jgi:2-polyprenyl-3-methyl-5-hydroxy-6-metoxy-1,4-benzoquinol methylase
MLKNNLDSPKSTSFEYGEEYQREQVQKHKMRKKNHWLPRINLAHELVNTWVLPRFQGRSIAEISVLDVGCSIGTMAIEFAARGFNVYAVDFDPAAIKIAKNLCEEEKVSVKFFQGDVAEWGGEMKSKVDMALCFDIFEHLHDDELGGMLQSIRRLLSSEGVLVFYTFPLQYDYLFFSRNILSWPLVPFKWLPAKYFERVVHLYAIFFDFWLMCLTGKTYKERISKLSHCNPTTLNRLKVVLERAGFTVPHIETDNIYPFKLDIVKRFKGQPIADRNLYGVAYPKTCSEEIKK